MPTLLATEATSRALDVNGIRLQCLEHPGDAPPIVLLHSLTGNARIFDGLVAAGLSPAFHLFVPDLRGRGATETTLAGYSLEQGRADIVALLDALGLERVVLCGHSFGGLLALYAAAHEPERVSHLILLDAGVEMHPATPLMVAAATARLDQLFPSIESYRAVVRMAPYVNRRYDEMNGFVEADLKRLAPHLYTTSSRGAVAATAALHVYAMSKGDWRSCAESVEQPSLLVHATEPFLMGMPMLQEDAAAETVALLDGTLASAEGNHFTMLFGPGAAEIVATVSQFLRDN